MRSPNAMWISDWNPDDPTFWNTKGKVIALRNLIWSPPRFFDLADLEHRRHKTEFGRL